MSVLKTEEYFEKVVEGLGDTDKHEFNYSYYNMINFATMYAGYILRKTEANEIETSEIGLHLQNVTNF